MPFSKVILRYGSPTALGPQAGQRLAESQDGSPVVLLRLVCNGKEKARDAP